MNWIKFDKDDESTWPDHMDEVIVSDGYRKLATIFYNKNGKFHNFLDSCFVLQGDFEAVSLNLKVNLEILVQMDTVKYWMKIKELPE
jgi:hypothetical protein